MKTLIFSLLILTSCSARDIGYTNGHLPPASYPKRTIPPKTIYRVCLVTFVLLSPIVYVTQNKE